MLIKIFFIWQSLFSLLFFYRLAREFMLNEPRFFFFVFFVIFLSKAISLRKKCNYILSGNIFPSLFAFLFRSVFSLPWANWLVSLPLFLLFSNDILHSFERETWDTIRQKNIKKRRSPIRSKSDSNKFGFEATYT